MLPTARESDSPRDGVLSTFSEVHAAAYGFALGYLRWHRRDAPAAYLFVVGALASSATAQAEVRAEPHYMIAGWACGAALGYLTRARD